MIKVLGCISVNSRFQYYTTYTRCHYGVNVVKGTEDFPVLLFWQLPLNFKLKKKNLKICLKKQVLTKTFIYLY